MHRLNGDIYVMQTIANAIEGTSGPSPSQSKRKEITDEIAIIQATIKQSCRRMLNAMTTEEINRLDLSQITKMFGDDKKKEIVDLLKK